MVSFYQEKHPLVLSSDSVCGLTGMHVVCLRFCKAGAIDSLDLLGLKRLQGCWPAAKCSETHPLITLLYLDSRHVRPGNGFVPNFLLFEKGDVNGENEQEVFTFLKVHDGLLKLTSLRLQLFTCSLITSCFVPCRTPALPSGMTLATPQADCSGSP